MSGLDTRAIEVGELPQKPAPDVGHEFRVFVLEEAFDRATTRGNAEQDREVGGVLVGEVCRDDGGPYVRVDTTIDALHAEEKGTELTFTHETWDHIHKEMDSKYQGKRIVGWYHTHPGFGIFLSDRDLFIQRSFFNLPYQIALVYDPKSREHGIFCWRENEAVRCRRHWLGKTEHIWDGPPASAAAVSPLQEKLELKEPAKSEPPQEFDRFTLGFSAVLVLLIGGFLGWWWGSRSANDVLERAQRNLINEYARGAKDVARELNANLIGLLRDDLNGPEVKARLDLSLRALESAIKSIPEGSIQKDSLDKLHEAGREIRRLLSDYAMAERYLRELEKAAQQTQLDPAKVLTRLQNQSVIIAQLCVVMAEDSGQKGDFKRASRLLTLAEKIDPGNRVLYARKRQALEKEKAR
jgi:proteasome lid subunit RPN8/RPN11